MPFLGSKVVRNFLVKIYFDSTLNIVENFVKHSNLSENLLRTILLNPLDFLINSNKFSPL